MFGAVESYRTTEASQAFTVRWGPLGCFETKRAFSSVPSPVGEPSGASLGTVPVMRPGAAAQGREPVAVIENTIWKQRTTD